MIYILAHHLWIIEFPIQQSSEFQAVIQCLFFPLEVSAISLIVRGNPFRVTIPNSHTVQNQLGRAQHFYPKCLCIETPLFNNYVSESALANWGKK